MYIYIYIYLFIYLFIFSILGPTKYTDEQYASPAFTNWWVQKNLVPFCPGTGQHKTLFAHPSQI